MDHASGVLDGKGLGDQKAAFKASLDQFNTMAVQFDNKVREKDKTACASFMLHCQCLSRSGTRYHPDATEDGTMPRIQEWRLVIQMMKPKAAEDAETLLQTYNSVINDLNVSQC